MIDAIFFPNMYPKKPMEVPLGILAVQDGSSCLWRGCGKPATVGAICTWSAEHLLEGRDVVELQVVCDHHLEAIEGSKATVVGKIEVRS